MIPVPPIYEFQDTLKLIPYDGATEHRIDDYEVVEVKHCKIEVASKMTMQDFQQVLLMGSIVLIPFAYNSGLDKNKFTIGSRIRIAKTNEEFTIKTVDVTNISGQDYAIEVFVA